jgi:hypothetical protein
MAYKTKPPERSLRVARPCVRVNKLPRELRSPVVLSRQSWLGKQVHAFRSDLVEHFGGIGNLTPLQCQAIEMCCQLKARLLSMDKSFADSGADTDEMSVYAAKSYLSFSNSLSRQLRDLGVQTAAITKLKATPPDLSERLQLLQGGKKGAA